jgi:hypothetical protein
MKILLILLCPVLLFSQTTVEVAYKLRLSKNDYWGYETFVVFDSTTTDELDLCCDASTFGGPSTALGIYTQIGTQYFLLNYFSQLTTDRVIDIHTFADPDTGSFVINVVDLIFHTKQKDLSLVKDFDFTLLHQSNSQLSMDVNQILEQHFL